MSKDALSGPSRVYVSGSSSSSSAVTGRPIGCPGGVFSGKLRTVVELGNAWSSGTSVTLMVTRMVSLAPPGSAARTVTEYCFRVS